MARISEVYRSHAHGRTSEPFVWALTIGHVVTTQESASKALAHLPVDKVAANQSCAAMPTEIARYTSRAQASPSINLD